MRSKGLLLASALLAAAVALGLVTAQAGTARADTASALPLSGFYQMAVDSANQHLFFSQGSGQNSILVTDFSGKTVATITGQDGAMGITLSPDGSTLYAALAGSHAVSAISTATLQQTALYQLPSTDTPDSVAVQSGRLWVSYVTGLTTSAIGDFDLSVPSPTLAPQPVMGAWNQPAPLLAADPSDSGVLVAVEAGAAAAGASSFDTAANPVTVRASAAGLNCEFADDVVVVPGGSRFVLACFATPGNYSYSTSDMSQQVYYATDHDPDAVAVDSATGTVAAAGTFAATNSPAVFVYAPGGATLLNGLGTGSDPVAARGLGLSSDASELFAVTLTGGGYALDVFDNPTITRSQLNLGGPATGIIGHAITLTGSLVLGSGVSPASGTPISVTRTGDSQTAQLSASTGTDGAFSVTDTPPALGTYTYEASYAGDVGTTPAITSFTVTATTNGSQLSLDAPPSAVLGKIITLTGQLTWSTGSPPAGTTISVTRGSVTLPAVHTDANGNFTLTDTPPAVGTYTYTASYAGDPQTTAAATATATVQVSLDTAHLSLGGGTSAFVGKPVTITGTLAYGTGAAPAGTKLTVTRTMPGTARKQFTVSTGASGAFKLTDKPTVVGSYTYTAKYAGNTTTAPATASRKVAVVRIPTALTLTTGATTVTYLPAVHVKAHLGPTYHNRVVSIYAQRLGSKTRTRLRTGKVDSHGNLTVSYRAAHSTTFTVVFAGDAYYAPTSITRTVRVRAKVTQSVSGYYGTTTRHRTTYHLFHSNGRVNDLVSVAPDKRGQCVNVEVQEYYQGTWNANTASGCIHLSRTSQLRVVFRVNHADHGIPYRMRADYTRKNSDVSNLSNDSSWFYVLVET